MSEIDYSTVSTDALRQLAKIARRAIAQWRQEIEEAKAGLRGSENELWELEQEIARREQEGQS